eukprot:CAMPEP_0113682878 /NCGR_PEP_ID=MMETSP0038_2-20120614/12938_1 /TAXON_ID=2898 /ORGANISM="Cryptomonas paramecium" /LENGTH=191 /DNA_ID=CAMNT_0000602057 /DNA_START=133 /DNA_END=704 /DNA_ORIENTATION=- /assembly_acc=CAM_ASM_000170
MTNSTQWERPGQPPPPPYPPPDTYEEAPPHTMTHTSTVPSVKSMPYGETLGVIPTGLPIHPANQPPMVAEPYRPPTLVPAIPPPPPGPIPGATMHLGGMMQPPPPPMVIPTTPGGYQVATAVVSDSTSSPYPADYHTWTWLQRRAWRKAHRLEVQKYRRAVKVDKWKARCSVFTCCFSGRAASPPPAAATA